MTKIGILPADDNTNGWGLILPAREPTAALEGEHRADWVVVGAGFAGLAAARRLAQSRPNDKVVLLDAQAVGDGASGRNAGFAVDVPHNTGGSGKGLEGSKSFTRLSRAAIAYLEDSVRTGKIACQWSQCGKYQATVAAQGISKLESFARRMEALGEPYRWLDHRQLTQEIGTPYYQAAVYTPGCILMNPVALSCGLADNLPENVTLHEHTPVTEVEFPNGVRLTTPNGNVYAPQLILATNGFAEQFGFFHNKLLTFAAYASLTRPLLAEERQELGGIDEWGLTPVNPFVGATMRLTQDHRILIRQRISYGPSFRRSETDRMATRRLHQTALKRRFPMLPSLAVDYTWTGFICVSRNHAPGFGRIGPNVYAAVCQNALGVTTGTISGVLAADMTLGQDNPLIADMESLGQPNPLPPKPFLRLGVEALYAYKRWKGRAEY